MRCWLSVTPKQLLGLSQRTNECLVDGGAYRLRKEVIVERGRVGAPGNGGLVHLPGIFFLNVLKLKFVRDPLQRIDYSEGIPSK